MSGSRHRAAIALLALTAGCFRTTAPKGFLPTADKAALDGYGGWARVDRKDGALMEGELLAATADTLHIHTLTSWTAVPVSDIKQITVTAYRIPLAPTRTWAVVGGVSTISHGFFLIISAPVWAIAGTMAAASVASAPRVQSLDPIVLRPWARFPQGPPEAIDRATIRMKYSPP